MKTSIVFVILVCASLAAAHAGPQESVAIELKGTTVAFRTNPQSADAKVLPLIDGKAGDKDRFGLCLGGVPASQKVIEILDKDGAVLKSISVSELLAGKGEGFTMLPRSDGNPAPRWTENRYSMDLPSGKTELLLKALAAGDGPSDQQLIVTFALKSERPTTLGLRASLSVVGSIESGGKGFLMGPKGGSASVAVSVYPGSATVEAGKSTVVLASAPVALEGSREKALLWLVMDGVASRTPGSARGQAASVLQQKRFGERDPRIVVVSSTDKQSTQPGDVVTYNVVCRNIGTADAADVTLSNPVSPGMQYQEGSATSDESSVSFDRTNIGGPVKNINWTFTTPIKPGEERLVSFRVQVQ